VEAERSVGTTLTASRRIIIKCRGDCSNCSTHTIKRSPYNVHPLGLHGGHMEQEIRTAIDAGDLEQDAVMDRTEQEACRR